MTHHLGEDLAAMADGGGALAPERRAELTRHVETCAECRRALEQAKLVLATVERDLAPPAPTQAFDARLFLRLDEIDREARATSAAAQRAKQASLPERIGAWLTPPRLGFLLGSVAASVLMVRTLSNRAPVSGGLGGGEQAKGSGELGENVEALAFAEDLDLYQDLDVVEDLDVLEDLDLIAELEGEPG